MGDTNEKIKWDIITEYPVVIIECTFLEEKDLEKSVKDKHMHWKHLGPVIKQNPNVSFILTHFSLRYTHSFIIEFFKKEDLKNVIPWLDQKIDI